MNIFFFTPCPKKNAEWYFDSHVRKMTLETAQLLSTAHRVLDGEKTKVKDKAGRNRTTYIFNDERQNAYYKSTHVNHPSAIWVRESKQNYLWTVDLFQALCEEYEFRFGKPHASSLMLEQFSRTPKNIHDNVFTLPPSVMDDKYKIGDVTENYRNYYATGKVHLLDYTNRQIPKWLEEEIGNG